MKSIEGNFQIKQNTKVAIVASRFNDFVVDQLVKGATVALTKHGVAEKNITLIRVPGAWELPLAAMKAAESEKYDAIIALGAVIRGATPHFDYVCAEAAKGLGQTMMQTGIPVGFGLLTTDTIEQAIERAGTKAGNKGADAAISALEMVSLSAQI